MVMPFALCWVVGDAVSRLVWAAFGVVAGCPIAMSLMCLNLLEPFDEFITQIPLELNELALCVDDFIMAGPTRHMKAMKAGWANIQAQLELVSFPLGLYI